VIQRTAPPLAPFERPKQKGTESVASALESSHSKPAQIATCSRAEPNAVLIAFKSSHHSKADSVQVFNPTPEDFAPIASADFPREVSVTALEVLHLADPTGPYPAATYVASGLSNGTMSLSRFEKRFRSLVPIQLQGVAQKPHAGSVSCLTFWCDSSDGSSPPFIISSGSENALEICKAETPKPEQAHDGSEAWKFQHVKRLQHHNEFVTCIDVENTTGTLLSGGEDWRACMYDMNRLDAGALQRWENHTYGVRCCSWSTSGEHKLNPYGLTDGASSAANHSAVFVTGGFDELGCVIDPRARLDRVAVLKTGAPVLTCCWGPSDSLLGSLPWLALGGGAEAGSFRVNTGNVEGYIRLYDPRMWKSIGDCTSYCVRPIQGPGADAILRCDSGATAEGDTIKERQAHRGGSVWSLSPIRLADNAVGLTSIGSDNVIKLWKLPRGPAGLLAPRLLQNAPNEVSKLNFRALVL